jgi:hypothetical protein
MSMAWVCSRHIVMSTVFFCAAWYIDLRAHAERWGAGKILAPAFFMASLATSESAFALLPLVFAQALSAVPREQRFRVFLNRWPWWMTAAVWLVVYAQLHYGAHHQDLYVLPWADPLRFLQLVWLRSAALVASALAGNG